MERLIRTLLTPPRFEDRDRSTTASQLHTILITILLLCLSFAFPFLFAPPMLKWRYLVIAGVIIPASLALMHFSRRGQVRLAGFLLISLLWLATTAGSFTAGGVRAPIFMGYFVTIVIASILLGRGAAVLTTLFSLVSGGLMALAEMQGTLPTPMLVYSPYASLLIYTFFAISILVLQNMASRDLTQALRLAHSELQERQRAEAARQESEARFRNIFDLAPYGILIINTGEVIIEVNAGFANMVGLSAAQLRGQRLIDTGLLINPNQLREWRTWFEQSNGLSDNTETSLRHSDGSPRALIFSARRIEFAGQPHALILCTDITARKQAEERQKQRAEEMVILNRVGQALTAGEDLYHALRAMVKELRKLMTADAFYVGIYDEDTDIISFPLYLNLEDDLQVPPRNLAERPGLTASVIQKRQTLYLPDVSLPEVQKTYQIVIIVDMEVRSYLGIPLINEGRIVGLMSIQACKPQAYSPDQVRMLETLASQVAITVEKLNLLEQLKSELEERKRAEAEVRKLNDGLEQRVAERTTELEQANQELQAFSYSVSHDLGAPLRSIRSYGQILNNDFSEQLEPQARNFLNKVIRSADEMNELIDSLLTLFRFSRETLHREPVDLSAAAAAILEILRHTEPDRPVTCLVTEGLAAHVDESLLRNVLENLLGNAWKYSLPNPAAQIEFGAQTIADETVYYVRDNGAGFDMQYANQLFKPFQRLHRADEFPGHGIGLATVQRIIQRHGGRIWAEASVGQGATFYFTLG